MKWEDVCGLAFLKIHGGPRERALPVRYSCPTAALAIINMQPRYASNPYVFATKGEFYIQGVSRSKSVFDKKAGVTNWTIHDLRRTASSLMKFVLVFAQILQSVFSVMPSGVLNPSMTGTPIRLRRPMP